MTQEPWISIYLKLREWKCCYSSPLQSKMFFNKKDLASSNTVAYMDLFKTGQPNFKFEIPLTA